MFFIKSLKEPPDNLTFVSGNTHAVYISIQVFHKMHLLQILTSLLFYKNCSTLELNPKWYIFYFKFFAPECMVSNSERLVEIYMRTLRSEMLSKSKKKPDMPVIGGCEDSALTLPTSHSLQLQQSKISTYIFIFYIIFVSFHL